MKLKQTIAAMALGFGLTAGAHAASELFTLPEMNPGNIGNTYATDHMLTRNIPSLTQGEQYWDFISFTVSDELVNNGSTVDLTFNLSNISLMGVQVYKDASGIEYDPAKLVAQTRAEGADTLKTSFGLESGTYTIFVSGFANGVNNSGSYSLSLSGTTAAIPEPETYAMMLAGLGMVGMITRRRKMAG
jgi:hypothetical protein